MDIKEVKKKLRKEIREIKKQYSLEEKKSLSSPVWEKLERETFFKQANIILMYWSMDDEVYTHDFVLNNYNDKKILLPCVDGEDLKLRVFNGMDSMKAGEQFGILEPIGEEFLDYDNIDLMIIPGVAFDCENNRLGRGRGFYDRLLKLCKAKKVGVCFDFQMVDSIPTESFDVKLDAVISNK